MRDVTAAGRELHEKFLALGNMSHKNADQVISAVGRPSSVSSLADGQTLLQWQETGCHMALLFDAKGEFVRITHQYAKYAPPPDKPVPPWIALIVIGGTVAVILLIVVRLLPR